MSRYNPNAIRPPAPPAESSNSNAKLPYMNPDMEYEHIPTVTNTQLRNSIPPKALERLQSHVDANAQLNEELYSAIQEEIKKKNTLTVEEYARYRPLFKKSIADSGLSYEEFYALSAEYKQRIDPQTKLTIIDPVKNTRIEKPAPFQTILPRDSSDMALTIFRNEGCSPYAGTREAATDVLAESITIAQSPNLDNVGHDQVETAKMIMDHVSGRHNLPIVSLKVNGVDILDDGSSKSENTKTEDVSTIIDENTDVVADNTDLNLFE